MFELSICDNSIKGTVHFIMFFKGNKNHPEGWFLSDNYKLSHSIKKRLESTLIHLISTNILYPIISHLSIANLKNTNIFLNRLYNSIICFICYFCDWCIGKSFFADFTYMNNIGYSVYFVSVTIFY